MLQFIFTYCAILSLGVLLVLIARSLPRVRGEEGEDGRGEAGPHGAVSRFILSDVPHKIDVALSRFLEKILRRFKISLLKFDNFLTNHLKRVSDQNKERPKIDFKDIENAAELGEKAPAQEQKFLP
ncbi:MAG: hypothetical protein V1489_01995 [Candidatus Liptonbacteria bacterium]